MFPDWSKMTDNEKFLWIVYEESYCDYDKRTIGWIKTHLRRFLNASEVSPNEMQLHFWSMAALDAVLDAYERGACEDDLIP